MWKRKEVFISYSRQDADAANDLSKLLRAHDRTVWRDAQELRPGEPFPARVAKALREATAVVTIWSAHSARSLWVAHETSYAVLAGKSVTLTLDGFAPRDLPEFYRTLHSGDLTATLADPTLLFERLDTLKRVPPRNWIDIWRLPVTFAERLHGRDTEMRDLFTAWESQGAQKTNVVVLDAMGGTGKSALVHHFLESMRERGWPGVDAVYGWSFYSQGTDDTRPGSAEPFLEAALEWFGHDGSPFPTQADKGARLADLIASRRTLLILDGLEPLQNAAGRSGGGPSLQGVTGSLKEQGLAALLRQLAPDNPGLVLVTTRLPIPELKNFRSPGVVRHPLTPLDSHAGIELLRALGVTGSKRELAAAVTDFRGHALALTHLGLYLATYFDGDVRRRDTVPSLMELEGQQERDPFRVMRAYEVQLQRLIDEARARGRAASETAAAKELALLFLIGLFDRPVEQDAVNALLAEPVILGLTDNLAGLSQGEWRNAVHGLRTLNLLAPRVPGHDEALDAHPLVREYFGTRLRQDRPAVWQAAHARLWQHYEAQAHDVDPDTVPEMLPVVHAIAHAAHTDQIDKAAALYDRKIKFKMAPRGLYEFDISVLLSFFAEPWRSLRPGIAEKRQAVILRRAQVSLQRSGRLAEAAEVADHACVILKQQQRWGRYVDQRVEHIQILIKLGRLRPAIEEAAAALAVVEAHPEAAGHRTDILCFLAHARHLSGNLNEAQVAFAESARLARSATSLQLSSFRQFAYNEYHLDVGTERGKEIVQRWTARVLAAARNPREIALDYLSLARLNLIEAASDMDSESRAHRYAEAAAHIEASLTGLRNNKEMDELPRALVLRAVLHRVTGQYAAAEKDLREVLYTSERFGMQLFTIDACLEVAQLEYVTGRRIPDLSGPDCLERAAKLMAETGYERRRAELDALLRRT